MINESNDKSTIDKNFKPKAKVPYKIVEYNQANSLKYFGSKDDYLKTKTGEIIIDTTNNQVIGFVLVKLNNKNIGPLKVIKEYRGQGFGDLLFKDAVTKYRGKQLGVYKDNQVAMKIYKKYCFKEVEDKGDYIIMTLNGHPLQEVKLENNFSENSLNNKVYK